MGAIEMESCVRAAVASPVGCMKYRLVVWLACSFIFDDFNTFYAVRTVIGSRQKHSHYFVVRTIVHVQWPRLWRFFLQCQFAIEELVRICS